MSAVGLDRANPLNKASMLNFVSHCKILLNISGSGVQFD